MKRFIGTIQARHVGMLPQNMKKEGIDWWLLREAIGPVLPLDVGKQIWAVETRHELGRGQATITTIYQVENEEQKNRRQAMEKVQ